MRPTAQLAISHRRLKGASILFVSGPLCSFSLTRGCQIKTPSRAREDAVSGFIAIPLLTPLRAVGVEAPTDFP